MALTYDSGTQPNTLGRIGILGRGYREVRQLPSKGEQKLLFAILEDGIKCYLRAAGEAPRRNSPDFLTAAEWLTSEDDSGPFSFIRLCAALDIDADLLRSGVVNHGRL